MSLAVPASYDEYYYTSQNDGLICDGGIMPLRNSADPTSTWYKNCLRAEDLMFLNEALNIKGKCCRRNNGVPTPTKFIDSSKLTNIRDNIGYMWDDGSPTMPNLQPHDFGDDSTGLRQYILDSFGSKTRYSENDSYYHNPLRADQIMNLFKDVKQLNYFYRQGGGRGSAVPYNSSRECVTERTYSDGHSPDTFTYSGYVWYDSIYYKSYDSTVEYHWDEHPTSKSLTFSLYSSGDMIPKTLVELAIWGGFYVTNYAGKMNEYSEYGDVTNKTTYVFVPIKSAYTNM